MLNQKQMTKYLRYTPFILSDYVRETKMEYLFTFKTQQKNILKGTLKKWGENQH